MGVVFLLRTTSMGWPDAHFHAPVAHLRLPAAIVFALCVIRTAAAGLFTAGIAARVSGVVAGVCGYLVLAQDVFDYAQTLHLLFLSTILLAIAGAGCVWALRPDPLHELISGIRLIRLFVASIYFWAALAKLRPDWLDGRTLALYHASGGLQGSLAVPFLAADARRATTAWTVFLIELALGPLILCARTRRLAVAFAILFHLGLEWAARPDYFGWLMIALLVAATTPSSSAR